MFMNGIRCEVKQRSNRSKEKVYADNKIIYI